MPSKPTSLKSAPQRKPWTRSPHKPDTRTHGRKGQEMRERRLRRTDGLCEHSPAKGRYTVATVENHKIPLAHGGPDEDENTENLCDPCDEIATAEQSATASGSRSARTAGLSRDDRQAENPG